MQGSATSVILPVQTAVTRCERAEQRADDVLVAPAAAEVEGGEAADVPQAGVGAEAKEGVDDVWLA